MPLAVPSEFLSVRYDYDRHPQSADFDRTQGANCQLWAYALLQHFGITVPPFRSSELWEDETHTAVPSDLKPLDLLLFNDRQEAWGAHVAVYLGDDTIAHLSQQAGVPTLCTIEELCRNQRYRVFIGAKRVGAPNQAVQRNRFARR